MNNKNTTAQIALLATAALLLTSCSDDKSSSVIPSFDKVVTDRPEYQKGDTLSYTVSFRTAGEYIGGTYGYAVSGLDGRTVKAGSTERYPAVTSFTERFVVPDSVGSFTLTISARTMAAYAGDSPYLDGSKMGRVSCTFSVTE